MSIYSTHAKYLDVGAAGFTVLMFASIILIEVLNERADDVLPVANDGKLRVASLTAVRLDYDRRSKILADALRRTNDESLRMEILAEQKAIAQQYRNNLLRSKRDGTLKGAIPSHLLLFCCYLPSIFVTMVVRVSKFGSAPVLVVGSLIAAQAVIVWGAIHQIRALDLVSAGLGL